MNSSVVELRNVSKLYRRGAEEIRAVNGVDLTLNRNEFVAIVGASGSGKTTLLNIIGCIDNPSEGSVIINSKDVTTMGPQQLTEVRRDTIGFVFQQFFLIPTLTAGENVQVPGLFSSNEKRGERAEELLDMVGLSNRINHLPSQMSGGEMQRVAIARALINSPEILLADEPTGNLDSRNAETIFDTFRRLNQQGLTIAVVTHSMDLADATRRIVSIKDGRVKES